MEEKELIEALVQLPTIMGGTIAQNGQIIEDNKGGCHFKITKEIVPVPLKPKPVVYMLSVSGNPKNRQSLIQYFIKILGKPIRQFQIKSLPHIDYVCWDTKKIDKKKEI